MRSLTTPRESTWEGERRDIAEAGRRRCERERASESRVSIIEDEEAEEAGAVEEAVERLRGRWERDSEKEGGKDEECVGGDEEGEESEEEEDKGVVAIVIDDDCCASSHSAPSANESLDETTTPEGRVRVKGPTGLGGRSC